MIYWINLQNIIAKKKLPSKTRIFIVILCSMGLNGCATFISLDTDMPLPKRIFLYSGTRLDWAAITKNDAALKKYNLPPPRYPLADLPLSFALDSIFLPITAYAEVFH